MKKLIPCLCFLSVFFMVSAYAHATKSYTKITNDNQVYTKAEVQVKQTDTDPILTTITLGSLTTRRAVLVTEIANKQNELVDLDLLIINVDVEASKVILKTEE